MLGLSKRNRVFRRRKKEMSTSEKKSKSSTMDMMQGSPAKMILRTRWKEKIWSNVQRGFCRCFRN